MSKIACYTYVYDKKAPNHSKCTWGPKKTPLSPHQEAEKKAAEEKVKELFKPHGQQRVFDPKSWINSCISLGQTSRTGKIGGMYQEDSERFMKICHEAYMKTNYSTKKLYTETPDDFAAAFVRSLVAWEERKSK